MRENGSLTTLVEDLKVLAEDAVALAESRTYKRMLIQCLLEPYDRGALVDFLALDNICRDLRILVGREGTAALWEARRRAFEEAWRDVRDTIRDPGTFRGGVHAGREPLRDVLLNVPYKRTPDDVYEQIEIGMK